MAWLGLFAANEVIPPFKNEAALLNSPQMTDSRSTVFSKALMVQLDQRCSGSGCYDKDICIIWFLMSLMCAHR
jgi:hypothetical protein